MNYFALNLVFWQSARLLDYASSVTSQQTCLVSTTVYETRAKRSFKLRDLAADNIKVLLGKWLFGPLLGFKCEQIFSSFITTMRWLLSVK